MANIYEQVSSNTLLLKVLKKAHNVFKHLISASVLQLKKKI